MVRASRNTSRYNSSNNRKRRGGKRCGQKKEE
jgi:hypothetical protein